MLLLRLSSLKPSTSTKIYMFNSRRNVLIRSVASVLGDVAAGIAVASACVWLIEAATLGLFLSFLAWLIGSLVAMALSQYVVHPAIALLLSDRKLDVGIDAASVLAEFFLQASAAWTESLWVKLKPAFQAM